VVFPIRAIRSVHGEPGGVGVRIEQLVGQRDEGVDPVAWGMTATCGRGRPSGIQETSSRTELV
jgi:hypothetical protein